MYLTLQGFSSFENTKLQNCKRLRKTLLTSRNSLPVGCLGSSVGWASNFRSGYDLTVCESESHIGLCADSSEPALDSVFLSVCSSPAWAHARSLSLSKINKRLKNFKEETVFLQPPDKCLLGLCLDCPSGRKIIIHKATCILPEWLWEVEIFFFHMLILSFP